MIPLPEGETVATIILDAGLMLLVVIVVVRIAGLRSFAKMSSFDFAVTVATGSILAAIVLDPAKSFVHGFVGMAALLGAQVVVSLGRLASSAVNEAVDNTPLLLMDGPRILDENLRAGRVTKADLVAKLREANVLSFDEVRAVVLETTGDISVMHGDPDGVPLEPALIETVRRTA